MDKPNRKQTELIEDIVTKAQNQYHVTQNCNLNLQHSNKSQMEIESEQLPGNKSQ